MEQNIALYIGDNASGKTRTLKKIIKEEKQAGNAVVTNLDNIGYILDKNKFNLLKESKSTLFDRIMIDNEINRLSDSRIKYLFDLICAKGDVLVIDELDTSISTQNMIFVCIAIADCRKLWKRIYVSGYNSDLTRLFTDYDPEECVYTTTYNLYYLEDGKITKVSEDDECEYFDKIRY